MTFGSGMAIGAAALALLLSAGIGPAGVAAAQPARIDAARANYEALLSGRKQLGQLSPQELADVNALDKAVRGQDARSPSQRCIDDETKRAGGKPSDLAARVIDMKCRPPGEALDRR